MENEQNDLQPVETEETMIASIVTAGNPDTIVVIAERMAALAPRMKQAKETILATQTYPQDWQIFGEGDKATACLGSAGAERVGSLFGYKVSEMRYEKETTPGGYRYIYTGKMSMADKVIESTGIFASNNKFIGNGAANSDKALEDVSENNIQMAAYHTFCGNAIKALLGLRGIPVAEYNRMMSKTGADTKKTGSHSYGSGTKGGTSKDDTAKQQELMQLCVEMANAPAFVELAENGKDFQLCDVPFDLIDLPPEQLANAISIELSSFTGKDNNVVKGHIPSKLQAKWLNATLTKAKKLKKGE